MNRLIRLVTTAAAVLAAGSAGPAQAFDLTRPIRIPPGYACPGGQPFCPNVMPVPPGSSRLEVQSVGAYVAPAGPPAPSRPAAFAPVLAAPILTTSHPAPPSVPGHAAVVPPAIEIAEFGVENVTGQPLTFRVNVYAGPITLQPGERVEVRYPGSVQALAAVDTNGQYITRQMQPGQTYRLFFNVDHFDFGQY